MITFSILLLLIMCIFSSTGDGEDEEEGVENTEKGLQPGSNQGEPARPRQNPNPGQKTTRHSTKRRRALANKPQDFQVLCAF